VSRSPDLLPTLPRPAQVAAAYWLKHKGVRLVLNDGVSPAEVDRQRGTVRSVGWDFPPPFGSKECGAYSDMDAQ
jgi:hypothetical protein